MSEPERLHVTSWELLSSVKKAQNVHKETQNNHEHDRNVTGNDKKQQTTQHFCFPLTLSLSICPQVTQVNNKGVTQTDKTTGCVGEDHW